MRLPRTITLPARNALMALPYCPEPPGPALMSSMRLSATSVPSSPIAVRRISMPLSPVAIMLWRRRDQALGVERHDCRHRGIGDDVAADIAGNLFEPDRAAAAADDLAIGDAEIATRQAMDQP